MNGTSCPETIKELSKRKTLTLFVDGDRGGNLIIKDLLAVAEVDFVAKAPDGKEVEEITKKEIHNALRARISGEQAKLELGKEAPTDNRNQDRRQSNSRFQQRNQPRQQQSRPSAPQQKFAKRVELGDKEKQVFSGMLENLVGTRGAQVLDEKLQVLGKVPITELESTIKSLGKGVHAIVFDGVIERDLVKTAERADIKYLVAMDSKVNTSETKIGVFTVNQL